MPGRTLTIVALVGALTASISIASAQTPPKLDYEYFKSRVEPIFLTKRPDHARCYVCHAESNNSFHLEKLSPGAHAWTDEQSRRNYENVTHLVKPGDPLASKLLLHPLSPNDGGEEFHGGGWQFVSQKDPDWMTIADWVRQAK